jgi:hypothetical protein
MNKRVFSIYTGDEKTLSLKAIYQESGDPLDLTSCTEIIVQLPLADGTFTALPLAGEDSVVEILSPAALGKFNVLIESEVSELLLVGELMNFDVVFTISGVVFTVKYSGCLTVLQGS